MLPQTVWQKPFLKRCWENLSAIQSSLPAELCVIQTELCTAAGGLQRLLTQGHNSWHDNKLTDRLKKKKPFPRGACRLDESVCICWKGLSALCSCYCLTCETNSRSQGETEEMVKEFIVTDFLTSKFFPLKLHSSLFTAGVPHVSWDGEKREEKLSQSNKNKR